MPSRDDDITSEREDGDVTNRANQATAGHCETTVIAEAPTGARSAGDVAF